MGLRLRTSQGSDRSNPLFPLTPRRSGREGRGQAVCDRIHGRVGPDGLRRERALLGLDGAVLSAWVARFPSGTLHPHVFREPTSIRITVYRSYSHFGIKVFI